MQTITRDELRVLIEDGVVTLVEALPAPQYDAGHLPGALNLPGPLTAGLAAHLAPDRSLTVVTYCSGPNCARSKAAAAVFAHLGYSDVRVYLGGKSDWQTAGLLLEAERV